MLALIHIYHLRSLPIKLRIFLHVVVQSQEYKAIETVVIDLTLYLSYHCYKVELLLSHIWFRLMSSFPRTKIILTPHHTAIYASVQCLNHLRTVLNKIRFFIQNRSVMIVNHCLQPSFLTQSAKDWQEHCKYTNDSGLMIHILLSFKSTALLEIFPQIPTLQARIINSMCCRLC